MLLLMDANFVDGHDIRMIQMRRSLGFGVKTLDVGGARKLARENHLEGDDAVEADLPRLEDDAHAAACDLRENLVIAESSPGERHGNRRRRRRLRRIDSDRMARFAGANGKKLSTRRTLDGLTDQIFLDIDRDRAGGASGLDRHGEYPRWQLGTPRRG